jgi:hypothetical protein
MTTIHIANDFSPFIHGATAESGPNSAERLRQELLVPALQQGDLEVNLDDVLGFSSTFLKAAFGGLVTIEGYSKEHLRNHLKVVGGVGSDRDLVWIFIEEAA